MNKSASQAQEDFCGSCFTWRYSNVVSLGKDVNRVEGDFGKRKCKIFCCWNLFVVCFVMKIEWGISVD